MTKILLLGGTGKTARRIAPRLRAAGAAVRTAARSGADVHFDWDDVSTHDPALADVHALYLVPPALRLDAAPAVKAFLDRAQGAGVSHVTFLSARGVELAPEEMMLRAIEKDLEGRSDLTYSILRPGWFMQDFDEYFFQPAIAADGLLIAPTGDGAEAFVHADDIADVATATLLDPAGHHRGEYALTGPGALTFAQVAEKISVAAGKPVAHVDPPVADWIESAIAGGIPADYGQILGWLFDAIRASTNAASTDDVERVTGHAPRSFDDYLADPATVSAWIAPSAVGAA
ncbi:NAD(P)H-binding protein [Solirubrobacter ginsenosidimutans]|uniref:NAD(P)H-binding protein n=1 Tax=Solirubrobacter ginsenosidimutans TaxID=490573 RepID=A0A9X3MRD3_9ACTN|nr:NAD(P)H-binding protein [Solirubrobacter ginsenosidimutans]MDA0161556.1 NAD(P)H-binding protein [Solirubrobacter ginsenosidimutans]